MGFRLTLKGGKALGDVASSVVSRLARDSGRGEAESRRLADSARCACQSALGGAEIVERSVLDAEAALSVTVTGSGSAREVCVAADASPESTCAG